MITNTPIKSYLLDISSINDESFNRLIKLVKPYRKEKIEKLTLKKSKYLSLAVELLIIKACKDFNIDYLNEEIVFNDYGKPSFKYSKYFFNTSHSGKYALCVICDAIIGCDIEEIKQYKEKVAERCFTAKENKYIDVVLDKDDMFYRLWTLKESYTKCLGTGLSINMKSFELDNKDNDIIIKGSNDYQFIEAKYDNYRLAFCIKCKDKNKYIHNSSLVTLD